MTTKKPQFSVDTHLFRELGELLVGRDSTALVELIKNSYDADATEVVVWAEHLDDAAQGRILVKDNGLGMTRVQFEQGFLRIASRSKEGGLRRSPRLGRRYTGEKGIGRLAAHKLACKLTVDSVANAPKSGRPIERVQAVIDWDLIENQAETLDDLPAGAVEVRSEPVTARKGRKLTVGTTITLTGLRRKWTERERMHFVSEAQSTRPPQFLLAPLARTVLDKKLLFGAPQVYSGTSAAKSVQADWALRLDGDFDVGDEYWQTLAEQSSWILEIDASRADVVYYGIAPTVRTSASNPDAVAQTFRHRPDNATPHPCFHARILIRVGAAQRKSHAQWVRRQYGIRVFMEGFRVLPYGEPGDDWLELDREYANRSRGISDLANQLFDDTMDAGTSGDKDRDAGLNTFPNRQVYGAVFLTHEGAGSLKMLVNREGFVPDASLTSLRDLVKLGISLATRTHAAAEQPQREKRREQRAANRVAAETAGSTPPLAVIERTIQTTRQQVREAHAQLGAKATKVRESLIEVESQLEAASAHTKAMRDEQSMIRVLASVGTQMAGFVHELNGLLGLVQSIARMVERLRQAWRDADPPKARKLAQVAASLADLQRALERQGAYLTEIATPDARRRRSRQRLADCFDKACELIAHEAEQRDIKISNKIPVALKSAPMFRAEAIAVFSNLLTNAIKAAGSGGRILASGSQAVDGGATVRIQNTGVAVTPEPGERWFRPFESTTAMASATLGQGMGLGLPITRSLLEERGATIAFIKPTGKYATAIQIRFPR